MFYMHKLQQHADIKSINLYENDVRYILANSKAYSEAVKSFVATFDTQEAAQNILNNNSNAEWVDPRDGEVDKEVADTTEIKDENHA